MGMRRATGFGIRFSCWISTCCPFRYFGKIEPETRNRKPPTFLFVVLLFLSTYCNPSTRNNLFSKGIPVGQVPAALEEASGLVASTTNPGLLWTLNDSDNPAEVFLIDHHANIKLTCTLVRGHNRDWEEVAVGFGQDPGKKYVYVGDIGDNNAIYDLKFIYRFEEPTLAGEPALTITRFDTLILKMPDGPRDTEAMLIDPGTGDLYLVSKREQAVGLYLAAYPFSKDTITLRKLMTMPYTKIVGGNISADGNEVLLKDYDNIYYWRRQPREPLQDLFARPPLHLSYDREPQGEAIAWSLEGDRFFTLSEGSKLERANLMEYNRTKGKREEPRTKSADAK